MCEKRVFTFPSTDLLFNQYLDRAEGLDLPGAPAIRRRNLRSYLESFGARPKALIVGEAAGPRGCRFSGVPFTGERLLEEGRLPFHGRRTSAREPAYLEASGTILWKALLPRFGEFLLWNAVPLHPHRPGEPLSIRPPSRAEIEAFSGALGEVIEALSPRRVVALGRKAEAALGLVGIEAAYVRHPSRSGARAFRAGIERALGGGARRGC